MPKLDPTQIKDLSTLDQLRSEGIYVYDNSMISNYNRCMYFGYLRHELGLTPISTEPNYGLEFGQGLHLAIETWLKAGRRYPNNAIRAFKTYFAPNEQPQKVSEKTGKPLMTLYTVIRGCSLLDAYFKKYANDQREIFEVEIPIMEELIEGVYLAGRIDAIYKDGLKITVQDHKSSKYYNDFVTIPNPQFHNYKFLVDRLTNTSTNLELDMIGVSGSKPINELLFRQPINYSQFQMDRWRDSVVYIVKEINDYRAKGFWPQRWDCKKYWKDCIFMPICQSASQKDAENLIRTMYKVDKWDPFKTGE